MRFYHVMRNANEKKERDKEREREWMFLEDEIMKITKEFYVWIFWIRFKMAPSCAVLIFAKYMYIYNIFNKPKLIVLWCTLCMKGNQHLFPRCRRPFAALAQQQQSCAMCMLLLLNDFLKFATTTNHIQCNNTMHFINI